MNERLNIEIGYWLDKLDDKYCQQVESYTNADIRETVQHFYSLALEDVRKEVERRITEQQKWIECGYGGHEIAIRNELNEVKTFIDNLTK